ncbi:hypothetical protein [Nocardia rhamnosiphila]|uniref:hypothetical protein n=2 Tax=Nocardia TaxID=1817 RepID=UPI0007A53F7C|nr:hypothetical protein [Nocardia rhamnosiphila]
MSTPIGPTITGESWEVVAHSRNTVAGLLDRLIEGTAACGCPYGADSLKHYDVLSSVTRQQYCADVLAGLLAEAVTRLAGHKAGEQ